MDDLRFYEVAGEVGVEPTKMTGSEPVALPLGDSPAGYVIMVEDIGFEPMTPSLQSSCSPN